MTHTNEVRNADRSTVQLVKDLSEQTTHLMRTEAKLAVREVTTKAKRGATDEDLRHDIELTREELGQTAAELAAKADVKLSKVPFTAPAHGTRCQARTIAIGQSALCRAAWLTEPSNARRTGPRPWLPMTSSAALPARSGRACAGRSVTTVQSTRTSG